MVLLFSRKSILGIDAFPFSVKRELVLDNADCYPIDFIHHFGNHLNDATICCLPARRADFNPGRVLTWVCVSPTMTPNSAKSIRGTIGSQS